MFVQKRRVLGLFGPVSLLTTVACSGHSSETTVPDAAPQAAVVEEAEQTASAMPAPNTGGMWLPMQMVSHADDLKTRGYQGDPAQLADPSKFPLSAVVSLGGCSGSFVSPDGLIVTNHHCVTRILQYNSSAQENLIEDGYVAKNKSQERWAGPTQRIYVTTGYKDVSATVKQAAQAAAAGDRVKAIEDKTEELENACQAGRPEVRCSVVSFFEGEQYFQIEQLELRDIRLVYAPAAGVGNFGGETDNWRWPRHAGDFSFLRAYVGPDGKPADHAAQNVPFKSTSHLKVATGDLDAGDFVMVAGYPGRTSRLKTADEVYDAMSDYLPKSIARYEQYADVLKQLAASEKELAIKVHSKIRGYDNVLTKLKGTLEGLDKGGLARKKAAQEAEIRQWVAGDAQRFATYHDVLDEMARVSAALRVDRDAQIAAMELARGSQLVGVARMAWEAAKERDEAGKDPLKLEALARSQSRRLQRLEADFQSYDPRIDQALLELAVQRNLALPVDQQPVLLSAVIGKKTDEASVRKAIESLVKKSKLSSLDAAKKLVETATIRQLERSSDPAVRLAVAAEKAEKQQEEATKQLVGELADLRPRFVGLLRAVHGDNLAADANSTLRLTYGSVRGYRPAADKPEYVPFSTVSQMAAKHKGSGEFNAPARLLAVTQAKEFGPYVDPELGEVPVDFLADLDITGGNSGSATINAKGELVGLAFDGNYEAMASDWMFLPEMQRSIHLDIRYALWMMDAVDGVDWLLEEMNVPAQINGQQPAPQALVGKPMAAAPAAGSVPTAAAAPAVEAKAVAPAAASATESAPANATQVAQQ